MDRLSINEIKESKPKNKTKLQKSKNNAKEEQKCLHLLRKAIKGMDFVIFGRNVFFIKVC